LSASIHAIAEFALKFPATMLVFIAITAGIIVLSSSQRHSVKSVSRTSLLLFFIFILGNAFLFESVYQGRRLMGEPERAIKISPLDPVLHFHRLQKSLAKKRLTQSLSQKSNVVEKEAISDILKSSPSPRYYHKLGTIFEREGSRTEAVQYYENAFWLHPTLDKHLISLVSAYVSILNKDITQIQLLKKRQEVESLIFNKIKNYFEIKSAKEQVWRESLVRNLKKEFEKIQNEELKQKLLNLLP